MSDVPTGRRDRALDLAGEWAYRPDPKQLGEHYPGQLAYTHWDDARWMRDESEAGWVPLAVPGPWPVPHTRRAEPVWLPPRFATPSTGDGTPLLRRFQ